MTSEYEIKQLDNGIIQLIADGLDYEEGGCLEVENIEELKRLSDIIKQYLDSKNN
jgi:plasmid replication initiation protein